MASSIESILEELREVNERISQDPADVTLLDRQKRLSKRLEEANALLNDKSKVLKG